MKFILAIPCFNCEKQIVRVLDKLSSSEICRQKINEVIVFDNQSVDNTRQATIETIKKNQLQNWVKLFVNQNNYNLGGTQKNAFKYAFEKGYTHLIVLHGDDQAEVEDLEQMLKLVVDNNKQNVLGARFTIKSKLVNYSKFRIMGNVSLNLLYSILYRVNIKDLGSGLNIFSIDDSLVSSLDLFSDELTFNMDLLQYLIVNKKQIYFFPISWIESDQISNAKIFKVGFNALKSLFRWRFLKPVRHSQCHNYRYAEI